MSDSKTSTELLDHPNGSLDAEAREHPRRRAESRRDESGPAEDMSRPGVDLSSYRKNGSPGDLIRRALWECVQLPFYPVRPRALSSIRVALLRLFGAKIGKNVLICGGVRVHVPWNLELGDYAAIGDKVEIYNLAPIRIGANTTISQHTYLCASSHDYTRTDFPLYSLPISIGEQAWVASGAFVAPGVTIGDGSVVGARSVVLRDVPPWTVAAGNPCRIIKPREIRRGGQPD